MGGVWTPPLKLVDGVWFGDRRPVARRRRPSSPAAGATRGWSFPTRAGLKVSRTDFAPDGRRAALFGLRADATRAPPRPSTVKVDAHSELMSHYPWAWTTAERGRLQPRRHRRASTAARSCSATGHAAHPNADAARLGRARRLRTAEPDGGETGPGHCGLAGRRRCCAPPRASSGCDEGPFGKGTGGQLRYTVDRPGARLADAVGRRRRLRQGRRAPRARELARGARRPGRRARRQDRGARAARRATRSSRCPATRGWRRASTGASRTSPTSRSAPTTCRSATSTRARQYPPPRARSRTRAGSAPATRTTRGSSPPTPSTRRSRASRVGQFEAIKDHMRALRDISEIVNGDSGKVAHEIVADGVGLVRRRTRTRATPTRRSSSRASSR